MSIASVLRARRDGRPHTRTEIEALVRGATDGSWADYQLSAWLMAACIHPLDREQTAWLTQAMAASGERLDLDGLPKPWVDKHSTGGVGDKTTIVLLPLLAACGLTVVKMSGRGLGITGGTVDKLGTVPGFRLDLSPDEMKAQAGRIGLALTGQTPNLAPADKTLYALRDATATVDSLPLICSSILSKKLAGGAETVVLDVKCGSGAFMADLEAARELADWLQDVGRRCGMDVRTNVTDVDQPLGSAVGNALEVQEALAVLRRDLAHPNVARFAELCRQFAAQTLLASGAETDEGLAHERVDRALRSGAAVEKAQAWFAGQGADPALVGSTKPLAQAPYVQDVLATRCGFVARMDARRVGEVALALGAGRQKKEDSIDPAVGVRVHAMVGDEVPAGAPLFTLHARTEGELEAAVPEILGAVEWSEAPVARRPLFL